MVGVRQVAVGEILGVAGDTQLQVDAQSQEAGGKLSVHDE